MYTDILQFTMTYLYKVTIEQIVHFHFLVVFIDGTQQ